MICPECGQPLPGIRTTCSGRCRQRRSVRLRHERENRAADLLARVATSSDADLALDARRILRSAP